VLSGHVLGFDGNTLNYSDVFDRAVVMTAHGRMKLVEVIAASNRGAASTDIVRDFGALENWLAFEPIMAECVDMTAFIAGSALAVAGGEVEQWPAD